MNKKVITVVNSARYCEVDLPYCAEWNDLIKKQEIGGIWMSAVKRWRFPIRNAPLVEASLMEVFATPGNERCITFKGAVTSDWEVIGMEFSLQNFQLLTCRFSEKPQATQLCRLTRPDNRREPFLKKHPFGVSFVVPEGTVMKITLPVSTVKAVMSDAANGLYPLDVTMDLGEEVGVVETEQDARPVVFVYMLGMPTDTLLDAYKKHAVLQQATQENSRLIYRMGGDMNGLRKLIESNFSTSIGEPVPADTGEVAGDTQPADLVLVSPMPLPS